jgi:hypothetical protein
MAELVAAVGTSSLLSVEKQSLPCHHECEWYALYQIGAVVSRSTRKRALVFLVENRDESPAGIRTLDQVHHRPQELIKHQCTNISCLGEHSEIDSCRVLICRISGG